MSDANNDERVRKHIGDGVVSTKTKKAREEEAVTDDEVEEFYAILRRINTAVKYFKSGADGVASLEKGIVQEVKSASTTTTRISTEQQHHLNLDLNLTPAP